jgi:hypothetical protein
MKLIAIRRNLQVGDVLQVPVHSKQSCDVGRRLDVDMSVCPRDAEGVAAIAPAQNRQTDLALECRDKAAESSPSRLQRICRRLNCIRRPMRWEQQDERRQQKSEKTRVREHHRVEMFSSNRLIDQSPSAATGSACTLLCLIE